MIAAATVADTPALARFRHAVRAAYADRVERIVLYGSRARGDARADSDWDIAVFLHDMHDFWQESRKLSDMATEILIDTGELLTPLPFAAGSYRDRTLLMWGVREDGIDL